MDRHQHPSNNDVLGAPRGMAADECVALPITRILYQDPPMDGVVSFWKPTVAELQLLNDGHAVRLSILGRTHPPLYVGVDGDGVML
jgi:hypothetical protein